MNTATLIRTLEAATAPSPEWDAARRVATVRWNTHRKANRDRLLSLLWVIRPDLKPVKVKKPPVPRVVKPRPKVKKPPKLKPARVVEFRTLKHGTQFRFAGHWASYHMIAGCAFRNGTFTPVKPEARVVRL